VDAEEADEFGLEVEEGAECGLAFIEVAEGAEKKVEKLGDGVLGLGDELDELDEIGGELGAEEVGAEAVEGLGDGDFAEGMNIALAAGVIADLFEEEEVKFSGEGAAWAAGAFGGGLEAAVCLGEPGDDPTGIAEAGTAEEDRGGAFHDDSIDGQGGMIKKCLMAEEATPTGAGENVPAIDAATLKTTYANVCRIAQTPNEMIVDFGLNPNFFGQILPEPLKLETRIILTHDAAKRLMLHLANSIQSYEAKYGVIELDITKRLKTTP